MQKQPRSTLPGSRLLKAAAACLLAVSASAMAAEEPPVRLVVPFPPGGSTDIAARIIQPKFAEALGRNVIVENKPGANTQIASAFVARSAPDGNTLLLSFDSHSINPIIKPDLPYDTFKDFKGIAFALRFPLVIGASQTTPGNNLKEFLEAAKAKPDAYNYASAGVGSLSQLAAEDLKRRAGVQILHVPYAGGGPMVQSLLNGSSNITMLSFAALKANIEAGKIKPLAITGTTRLRDLPDVPTVEESGYPGFEAYSWQAVWVPAATPDDVAKELSDAFLKALNDPDVKKRLNDIGFEVIATDGASAERYAVEQFDRWTQFVKETGLSLAE
ncbi:MAG TPA: tripartite tricarboxylate transporter substrate binding protein [Burkholderiaceae bacterium]|nr:tripartite tricarboxylate transporter substrate binding protein [Burkholderiaceae bacterium]